MLLNFIIIIIIIIIISGRTVARLVEELRHKTGGFGFRYR